MFKINLIILLSAFLLSSCVERKVDIVVGKSDTEIVMQIYKEAVEALKKGDAFFAGNKFKEAESLMPQSEWAAKASLMASYSDYSRNAYSNSIFGLERHLKNYPADKNIPYVHYLIAICYYEQILDEKKDLRPLLQSQTKFEYIIQNYPDTDYATDAFFKLNSGDQFHSLEAAVSLILEGQLSIIDCLFGLIKLFTLLLGKYSFIIFENSSALGLNAVTLYIC